MALSSETVLGIDLGTTFSCVAYVQGGRPRIIPSEKGYTTVPSVVGLDRRGEIVAGHPAIDQMVTNPDNTIYGSKRLIGRKFHSKVVQRMCKTMTYQIVEGEGGDASVVLGGKQHDLTDISGFVLAEIRDIAQGQLEREIKRAVITVPAYYNDNQRQAVKKAGALAGFTVDRIVNEPTAAGVAYGFKRGLNQKILVYDLGGGTFDVAVLHVDGNRFEVLATGGDTFLGGVDFDNCVVAYTLDRFMKSTGLDLRDEKISMVRVRAAAERAKRNLSQETQTTIQLPFITKKEEQPIDLMMDVSREQLNDLTLGLVNRTLTMCDGVLSTIQMKRSEIDEILLVGGQTRMPLIRTKIEEHFGKPARKGVHPDEVVALGAAILGNPVTATARVQFKDVLSIPIGVALLNGNFKVILDQNTPLPATTTYKVQVTKEETLDIDIYQGEHPKVADNEYIGTFRFPVPKKGKRGGRMLEMKFHLSRESLLTVNARDLETGEQTVSRMTALKRPQSFDGEESGPRKTGWLKSISDKILNRS